MPEIDDRTVAYILVAHSCFEDLKQVAAQLAGLLVLEAAGSKTPDHPMLASAAQVYWNAADGLRSARVPARAKAHHSHLLAAATQLNEALHGKGDPLVLLESAYAELRSASKTLPGFQMISFERGCCAEAPTGPLCAVKK
jgi:hypothetical protein